MGVGVGWMVGVNVGSRVAVGLGVVVGELVMVGVIVGGSGPMFPCDKFQPRIIEAMRIKAATLPNIINCFGVSFRVGAMGGGAATSRASSSSFAPHIKQVLAPSATLAPHTGQWRGGRSGND